MNVGTDVDIPFEVLLTQLITIHNGQRVLFGKCRNITNKYLIITRHFSFLLHSILSVVKLNNNGLLKSFNSNDAFSF